MYFFYIEVPYCCSEIQEQADTRDKAGGKVEMPFDAPSEKSDSTVTTTVFFRRKSSSCGEMTEEQLYTNYNFMYSQEKILRPLNYKFVSVRWVSRHVGRDVYMYHHL